MRHFVYAIFICLSVPAASAQPRIVVDSAGHGDFRTIQEALNSLSEQSPAPRTIFIRKGIYNEKIWGVATLNLRGSDITLNGPVCIWHDGSVDPDSKTVLKDCSFSGYDGFKLGRYHREAQFYLIHCSFAENMADQDIYLVPTATPLHWGRRIYYYDCHKKGTEYKWYANNLDQAAGSPDPGKIDPAWVFKTKWDPLN
ncbi:MAG TPA: hypothetical protein VNS58_05890 [Puia sp.]|nr:hypothetical protein [Puia sp.]